MRLNFLCLDDALKAENRQAGIFWMLATMLCFITLDATVKYCLQTYSLVQVTWARFFFAMIIAMLLCGRNLPQLAISRNFKVQGTRSLFLLSTTALFNAGLLHVPLPTATTIMFMSPILVTVISIFVLGEHVGLRRWSGIIFGFIGALIVMRVWESGFTSVDHGALLILAAAFTNASYQIATRALRQDHALTSLLYTAAIGAVVSSCALPWFWRMPDLIGWLLLISCGVSGCLGHLCLIRAFQAAPASIVAPFSYSSLIWSTLFGFMIWGDVPMWTTLAGASLIIGSGLYIFERERRSS